MKEINLRSVAKMDFSTVLVNQPEASRYFRDACHFEVLWLGVKQISVQIIRIDLIDVPSCEPLPARLLSAASTIQ